MTRATNSALAALFVVALCLPAACAAGGDPLAVGVNALEHRFFFRQYAQDPVEKRLERLELLVFGSTQAGTNDERLARLKRSVAERDRQAAADVPPKPPAGKAQPAPKPGGSSQYPILNTLEWRALKKTYPSDSLDQRLERLEEKLFGQSSPAMAYADRVERLKRTVGVGVAENKPSAGPVGPMPRARPRGSGGEGPWMYGSPLLPDFQPPGRYNMPFMDEPPQRFADIFKELDRQMENMLRMAPGGVDPGSGLWISPDGRKRFKIDPQNPGGGSTPAQPKLPPYYDPNSI